MPAPDRRIPPTEHNKEGFNHLARLYVEDMGHYQPSLNKSVQALRKEGIYIDNEVYSSTERRELPFYADIIAPQGISSQLIVGTYFHGAYRGTYYLSRHRPVNRFRSSTLDRIRPLLPALTWVEIAASAPLGRAIAGQAAGSVDSPESTLGAREREVARLASRGLETKEIAALLGISPATVRNQLHMIYQKLDVSNRAELAFVLKGSPHA
jgi:DNA-binding CsgD family transcriptional regulator